MMQEAELMLAEKIKARLKAESLDLSDKEQCLKCLERCVLGAKCKQVYLKHVAKFEGYIV